MYDFYPDDWRGPEPFESLLDAPDDVGVSPTPAALPPEPPTARLPLLDAPDPERHYDWCGGNCGGSCERSKRNLEAPSVKALSHAQTLGEIAMSPNVSAKTRMTARRILKRGPIVDAFTIRTEDLRGL